MYIPNVSNISKMPENIAITRLPYVVLKLINGAEVINPYRNKSDVVCIYFDGCEEQIHIEDFEQAKLVADYVKNNWINANRLETSYHTLRNIIDIHLLSTQLLKSKYETKCNKKKVIFIKGDDTGCGYWRMVLPARYLDEKDYFIDVSTVEVIYDYLLEYDVICVQRVSDWNSYYVIEKLKKAGKKIVYDIDDNMYELPDYHPVKNKFTNDSRESSMAIIRIVDNVVVTNQNLKNTLVEQIGNEIKDKIIIIPNAIDIDNYPIKRIYPFCSSQPIKPFRILWSGSATHEYDMMQCVEALDKFMINHADHNVRIMFMGYIPVCVRKKLSNDAWKDKTEYVEFKNIETYFNMLYRVNADIGIAPLVDCPFNRNKSNIKWIEYTLAGIPVAASNIPPYSDVIDNGVNGYLINNEEEWLSVFEKKFNTRKNDIWQDMVNKSRLKIESNYNIVTKINEWKKIFE